MKRYYIEMIDDDGEVIFQSNWFKTKKKAKDWVFNNLFFQNGYDNYVEIVICESKLAKNDKEFFDYGYDCIKTEKIYLI